MHNDKYVFSQLVEFTDNFKYLRIVRKYDDKSLIRGVSITIVITETGHRELEMAQMGINILHRPDCKMQTAVIDRKLSWYGNINFIGRPLGDANAIRLESPDFAMQLIEVLEG